MISLAPIAETPTRVEQLWPGETIVLLGGGPSLTRADVNACRGQAHVIAIKEAWQLAPWAEILYACDATFWNYYKGVPEFTGHKYGLEATRFPDVRVLQNTGDEGLELEPTGLRTGHNSGYQALNLAVHLGAARIVLLGFDCWADGTKQNWHTAKRYHRPSPYPMFLMRFATLVEPLKALKIEVLNCSRRTVLTSFPRVPLEEVQW